MLAAHGVTLLVDVRTVPRSRHNPQFNAEALPERLSGAQIGYAHAAGLGGFRTRRPIRRMLAGATCRSVGTLTTCRRPNFPRS